MAWMRRKARLSAQRLVLIGAVVLLLGFTIVDAEKFDETCGTLHTPGVTIPSGDIIVREGDSLQISCQLNDKYMKRPDHVNSSDLVFYRDTELIPAEMVEVVSSSTIKLHIMNMTESSSIYYCKFSNMTAVCLNKVAVGSQPKQTQNFTCVSQSWFNLTCTWRVPTNYVATQYKLTYRLPGRAGRNVDYGCPENQPVRVSEGVYSCFWNLRTKPHYRQSYKTFSFTMNGTNVFGSNVQKIEFNHFAHVIPGRPENLTLVNKTTNGAFIAWSINGPMINFPPGIHHRIMYQSQYDTRDFWHNEEAHKLTLNDHFFMYELKHLEYAHALYDIRVQMQSSDARGEDWWSQFSSLTIRTKSELPGAAPRTDVGSFEISGGANHRDVYVYWQQIRDTLQNGENFSYKIAVRENGEYKNIVPNQTTSSYAKFKKLQEYEYEFDVYSSNEIGNSTQYSKVRVPAYTQSVSEPISFTKIAFEERTYELSWKPPEKVDSGDPITSYTVFWCKNDRDRPYQCTGFLNWTRVDAHVTILNQTVEDNSIYQFAISANTATASSGMVWASCTVIHNKFVGKMKTVWINQIGPTYIQVGWKLDCSDRIGIVIGYRIYFCAIGDPQKPACIEPERSVKINGDLNTMNGLVENLRPYTTYMLAVAVITKLEEGQRSDLKYNTTYESSPDAPRNLHISNITNNSMYLEWSPPDSMNGVLRYYLVKYGAKVEKVNFGTNVTLTNLQSYTTYMVEVSACTISCSKPALRQIITLVGVPGDMESPAIKFMNKSQMTLTWKPPAVFGGPNVFELRIERIQDDEDSFEIFNTTDQHLTIQTPECNRESNANVMFKWSVRAVTVNETGVRLEGPWSDSINNACQEPSSSAVLIYCLLVTSAIICLCIFAFCSNKVWVRCKHMKDVEIKLPPGLTPPIGGGDMSITHTALKSAKERVQEDSHVMHKLAADEQRLLEKKRECENEMDCTTVSPPDSSVCISGSDSIPSSMGSVPMTKMDLVGEQNVPSDKDSCSLRLRNVPSKPSMHMDTALSHPHSGIGAPAWAKGYVTMPTADKVDTFTGSWSKPSKCVDGYSQIGVDAANQPTILPTSGYVPYPMLASPTLTDSVPLNLAMPAHLHCISLGAMGYDDECENVECPQPEPNLVDLRQSRAESDIGDLINIDENPDEFPKQVTDEAVLPYVSLSSVRSPPPPSQQLYKVVDPKPPQAADVVADAVLMGEKPTTPNPYSRIGTWNTPAKVVSNAATGGYVKFGASEELGGAMSPDVNPPTNSKSSYVPHRQFDSKLLKED